VVTFESDWRRAKEIMLFHAANVVEGLQDHVRHRIARMTEKYMIYYEKFTPIVYVDIKDSGIRLTLRYLTEAKKRRSTTDDICSYILDDFAKEPNVHLAYQTFRVVQQ